MSRTHSPNVSPLGSQEHARKSLAPRKTRRWLCPGCQSAPSAGCAGISAGTVLLKMAGTRHTVISLSDTLEDGGSNWTMGGDRKQLFYA